MYKRQVQNAVLEEVVMIGYLLTRWRQAGVATGVAVVGSAVLRGRGGATGAGRGAMGRAISRAMPPLRQTIAEEGPISGF